MSKIYFCIPKLHNNLLPWSDELLENKIDVEYIVIRKNPLLNRKVTILPGSKILISFLKKIRLISKKESFYGKLSDPATQMDKFFLPNIFYLIKKYKSKEVDYVFLRINLGIYFISCLFLSVIFNKKILLYSQGSFLTYESLKKKYILRFFKSIGVKHWISPSFSLVGKHNFTSSYNTFIPFYNISNKLTGNSEKKLKIIVVGKYIERKNHLNILKTINDNNLRDINFNFYGEIIKNNGVYFKTCKDYIEKNKLKNVKLYSNIDYNLVLKEYAIHDVLVLMSENERCSFTQIEAMSNGLACIIGEDNGSASYIINDINGFVLGKNDFVMLAKKLKFLNDNRNILELFKKNSININKANRNISKLSLKNIFSY